MNFSMDIVQMENSIDVLSTSANNITKLILEIKALKRNLNEVWYDPSKNALDTKLDEVIGEVEFRANQLKDLSKVMTSHKDTIRGNLNLTKNEIEANWGV